MPQPFIHITMVVGVLKAYFYSFSHLCLTLLPYIFTIYPKSSDRGHDQNGGRKSNSL
jgi:hypothetical protein